MNTLNDIKVTALRVLQQTNANPGLEALVDSSFELVRTELQQLRDWSASIRVLPVYMLPGVVYDRQLVAKLRGRLTYDAGDESFKVAFSGSEHTKIWDTGVEFEVLSQVWSNVGGFLNLVYDAEISTSAVETANGTKVLVLSNLVQESVATVISFEQDVEIMVRYVGAIRKIRHFFTGGGPANPKVPVRLLTIEAHLGEVQQQARMSQNMTVSRPKIISKNSREFEVINAEFDGYAVVVMDVTSWSTPMGQALFEASRAVIFWNAVVVGNHLVGVFLPRQEGALPAPEQARQNAIDAAILDDSYLQDNSYNEIR